MNFEKLFYKKQFTLVCELAVTASKEEPLQQNLCHELDLSLTGRNGDFLCPRCGLLLSPEDETENNYCILETTVNSMRLESLIVQCQRCSGMIRLVGFSVGDLVEGEK